MTGPVTIGWIIGWAIFIPLVLWFVGSFVWAYLDSHVRGFALGSAGTAFISLLLWAFCMWPFAYEYHHWVRVEGTVQNIGKRLVSNGDKGMSQRYVFMINGHPYGVDDTRASLIHKGDSVRLACKREFEWGVPREANGWACRWRGSV